MSAELKSHFPAEVLEQRAGEQRQRIHNSVDELKSSLRETVREHLDVESHARENIWRFVAGAAMVALVSGYNVAGMFTRR
jgi:hypothetical protein